MRTSLAEVPSSPLNRHVIVSMQSPMRIARAHAEADLAGRAQRARPDRGAADLRRGVHLAHAEFVKPLRV